VGAKSGRKKATKAQEAASKSAGFKRLALVLFGAAFIALFVIFAVAQGIGQPSVPDGDVAMVKGIPDGNVSEADYKRALLQQVTQEGLKKIPSESSEKFAELKEKTLNEGILQPLWIRGEAEELGVSVTPKQVESELAQIKKSSFPTEKAFQEFLKTSHLTAEDVNKRLELQLLSGAVQQKVASNVKEASRSEIAEYYETEKANQFTVKPTRDIRVIINKDKAKTEAAKEALEGDDSAANWKVVAKKYSEDPTSSSKGGLQKEISAELLRGPLKNAIFGSATGEIVGPVGFQKNYFVIEVEKLNPRKVKTLAEVGSQISTQLTEQLQQEFFADWVSEFQSKWRSRTFCASGFLVSYCSNYKGSGHPTSAPEACYEANPKTPATECPAPVEQTQPTLPGKVTNLKPKGEPLVQRPRPPASAEAGAGEAVEPEVSPETGE
jgi:parvulin-like peptidyl-prolyl isomerase